MLNVELKGYSLFVIHYSLLADCRLYILDVELE
jgi:hypothetical protein